MWGRARCRSHLQFQDVRRLTCGFVTTTRGIGHWHRLFISENPNRVDEGRKTERTFPKGPTQQEIKSDSVLGTAKPARTRRNWYLVQGTIQVQGDRLDVSMGSSPERDRSTWRIVGRAWWSGFVQRRARKCTICISSVRSAALFRCRPHFDSCLLACLLPRAERDLCWRQQEKTNSGASHTQSPMHHIQKRTLHSSQARFSIYMEATVSRHTSVAFTYGGAVSCSSSKPEASSYLGLDFFIHWAVYGHEAPSSPSPRADSPQLQLLYYSALVSVRPRKKLWLIYHEVKRPPRLHWTWNCTKIGRVVVSAAAHKFNLVAR